MGEIIVPVNVWNALDNSKSMKFNALVDTGASLLVLPEAWRGKLGRLDKIRKADVIIANNKTIKADICGPVKIQMKGFRYIFSEVVFIEMSKKNGDYEPLVGYIILESSLAVADPVNQKLVHLKSFYVK